MAFIELVYLSTSVFDRYSAEVFWVLCCWFYFVLIYSLDWSSGQCQFHSCRPLSICALY